MRENLRGPEGTSPERRGRTSGDRRGRSERDAVPPDRMAFSTFTCRLLLRRQCPERLWRVSEGNSWQSLIISRNRGSPAITGTRPAKRMSDCPSCAEPYQRRSCRSWRRSWSHLDSSSAGWKFEFSWCWASTRRSGHLQTGYSLEVLVPPLTGLLPGNS